ncbi:hypothetical protein [Melittangium boletus]|uniref:hypothetical protein n=1 Tax=Melittangium boletus TaxID=83453 RepID=UPI003DA3931A
MSPSLRRLVVVLVLIALLVFDWHPDARLLSEPARRRQEDRPLPEDPEGVATPAARATRALPQRATRGPRQAARRRLPFE